MEVSVRLFAVQRELAGTREVRLDLLEGATVEAAWDALVARLPVLAPGRPSMRFARNGDYVTPDIVLTDGDELACIPPVSGGQGADEAGRIRILEIRGGPLDHEILVELGDRLATNGDGAVVGFLGRTRETPGTPAPGQEAAAASFAGETVEELTYEAHEEMALRVLDDIADEIAVRFGVDRLAIVHRTGTVPVGEASVAIVAVAPHRDDAFAAARYAIDETKARAPIWKAERFRSGARWVGEVARTGPLEGDEAGGGEER